MATESPNAERLAFYKRIGEHDMTPLWEVVHGLVIPEPKSPCAPALALPGTAKTRPVAGAAAAGIAFLRLSGHGTLCPMQGFRPEPAKCVRTHPESPHRAS